MTIKLELTRDQFRLLHESVDCSRSTTKVVKTDKRALALLLADHSKVLAALRGVAIEGEV